VAYWMDYTRKRHIWRDHSGTTLNRDRAKVRGGLIVAREDDQASGDLTADAATEGGFYLKGGEESKDDGIPSPGGWFFLAVGDVNEDADGLKLHRNLDFDDDDRYQETEIKDDPRFELCTRFVKPLISKADEVISVKDPRDADIKAKWGGRELPGKSTMMLVPGSEDSAQDLIAYGLWDGVLVSQHRGDKPGRFSTGVADVTGDGEIDEDLMAGLDTAVRVVELPESGCALSLAWGLPPNGGGGGLFHEGGDRYGWACFSGGGPIGQGFGPADRHHLLDGPNGESFNVGHLMLPAPWALTKIHDGPPDAELQKKLPDGNQGVLQRTHMRFDFDDLVWRWQTPVPVLIFDPNDPGGGGGEEDGGGGGKPKPPRVPPFDPNDPGGNLKPLHPGGGPFPFTPKAPIPPIPPSPPFPPGGAGGGPLNPHRPNPPRAYPVPGAPNNPLQPLHPGGWLNPPGPGEPGGPPANPGGSGSPGTTPGPRAPAPGGVGGPGETDSGTGNDSPGTPLPDPGQDFSGGIPGPGEPGGPPSDFEPFTSPEPEDDGPGGQLEGDNFGFEPFGFDPGPGGELPTEGFLPPNLVQLSFPDPTVELVNPGNPDASAGMGDEEDEETEDEALELVNAALSRGVLPVGAPEDGAPFKPTAGSWLCFTLPCLLGTPTANLTAGQDQTTNANPSREEAIAATAAAPVSFAMGFFGQEDPSTPSGFALTQDENDSGRQRFAPTTGGMGFVHPAETTVGEAASAANAQALAATKPGGMMSKTGIAMMPEFAFLAFGMPNLATGGIRSGYAQSLNGSGQFQIQAHDSDGNPVEFGKLTLDPTTGLLEAGGIDGGSFL